MAAHSKRRCRVVFLGFMNSVVAAFSDREMHVIPTRKTSAGSRNTQKSIFISPRPGRRGSIRSKTWFSILQGQSLTGASFTTVEQLQEHIDAFIAAYNETAAPFAWTKKRVYQRRFRNRRITQL